ncbi:MAG: hypothetical protein WCA52_00400 [Candidatus Aquilonibacter sp.]
MRIAIAPYYLRNLQRFERTRSFSGTSMSWNGAGQPQHLPAFANN